MYEEKAASYLQEIGYEILDRNFRSRYGEIDIIAKEGEYLVFLEVKQRSGDAFGLPEEAVDGRKKSRIMQTARYYLYQKGYPEDTPCRFDVVAIERESIRLYKNAWNS